MSQLTSAIVNTWHGMIQRRLWPVAVLLLAGLVAVPLVLTSEPEPAPAPVAAGDEAGELAAQPLVAVASAAERESARRVLGARKDPFKPSNQPKAKKADKSGDSGDSDSPRAGGSPTSAGSKPSGGGPVPGSGGSGYVVPAPLPTSAPDGSRRKRPSGSLSVRWGVAGDEQLETLAVDRLDPLPNADEPLLVFLGLTKDRRSAVFMLDAGVTVDGDGRCRPTPGDCQTVELAPGETVFIEVAGEDGPKAQYQLDLVKIHGRRAARTPTKDAAAQARATSRALSSLGGPASSYRFDARTGTLERVATAGAAEQDIASGG